MEPHVALILPTHNTVAYTDPFFACVQRHWDAAIRQVIVIDNGSDDATPEVLRKWQHTLRHERNVLFTIITNPDNEGFARAVNQGLRYAMGNWKVTHLCIANNDLLLRERWLYWLLRVMEEHATIGMAASFEFSSYRCGFSGDHYPRMRLPGNDPLLPVDFSLRFTATGIPWLIRRNVVENVGLFDEGFRMGWYEDIDYWVRMVRAGWEFCYVKNAPSYHFGHRSFEAVKAKIKNDWEGANAIRFRQKHGGEYPSLPPLWGFDPEEHAEALKWGT